MPEQVSVELEKTAEELGLRAGIPEVVEIGYGMWAENPEGVKAALFAQLVKRTNGVVKHYVSDLYHDARWLRESFTEPGVFFYAARGMGTHIGLPLEVVLGAVMWSTDQLWQVELRVEGRLDKVTAIFTPLRPQPGVAR